MKGGKLFAAAALIMMLAAAAFIVAPADADDGDKLEIQKVEYREITGMGNFFFITFSDNPVDATVFVYVNDDLVACEDVATKKAAVKIEGSYTEGQSLKILVTSANGDDSYPKYTVTFQDQDEKVLETMTVGVDQPVHYDVPPKTDYEFKEASSVPEIASFSFNVEEMYIDFQMPASDVIVTVEYESLIVKYTVTYVDQDGEPLSVPLEYEEGDPVHFVVPPHEGVFVNATSTPEVSGFAYDADKYTVDFTMPAENVKVTINYAKVVSISATAAKTEYTVGETFDADGLTVTAKYDDGSEKVLEAGAYTYSPEGALALTDDKVTVTLKDDTAITCDVPISVTEKPETVSVTFVDGETETVVLVNLGECVVAPKEAGKEGYNFVGWFKEGFEQSFDFETPITEPLTLFAKYIEKPDIGEGYAILYHDMCDGKPVDIWWKGYKSMDDRVMLANGMDATAKFQYWLAEDQKTKLTMNAAYDLNDINRNDCLIYPASYGMPGHDHIYELNAVYALEIEWIGYDGETVMKTDDVIRGDNLVAPEDDKTMQEILDDMPADEGYTYSWAGWEIRDIEKTYTSEQIGSVKANGAWKIYATFDKEVKVYDITFISHEGSAVVKTPYGEVPEIENPLAYEDDNFTYTFAGWDPEVKKVDGDATYIAMYAKTSLTKDVTITVNDPVRGYFTYGDKKNTEYILKVPMDFDVADIDEDVLTFELLFYLLDIEIPETLVITAVPNDDDFDANKHFEFVKWNVSEDGLTYTAEFTEDIITSTDLDRILTFFDSTKAEDGKVRFTIGSKDGLAIPKGTMTVYYYEMEYNQRLGIYTQVEKHCDPISMDWGEDYGKNLISATIVYDDLKQDGEAFDITTKDISVMWLDFDGVNEAESKSNKATPGQ